MQIDSEGWCDSAIHVCSPNCDVRPEGVAVDLLVIHNISLPPDTFGRIGTEPWPQGGAAIAALFTNTLDGKAHPYFATLAGLRVSAHFLIERDGTLTQFVSCHERAWHAGVSSLEGRTQCNGFSIGIELEGSDFVPFTDLQYTTLAALTEALCLAFPLAIVAGHNEIAPQRKTDPGPFFEWERYFGMLVNLPSASILRRIIRA